MPTVKPLRKLAVQVQAGATYEDNAMLLMPFTSATPNQTFDPIEDESNVGVGFKDIPQQGVRHIAFDVSQQLDVISCIPILEAAFGSNTSGVFALGSNTKKLSVASLNSVHCSEFANVYVSKLSLKGSANQKFMMDYSLIGATEEVRAVVGDFPASPTPNEVALTFPEAGGSVGYFRLGDTSDALGSGDNLDIEDFNLEITTGFDEQFYNDRGTLVPVFGMVPPVCSGSVIVSRHSADTLLAFRDAHTPLQAQLYIRKGATANVTIQIPRLVIGLDLSDDDVTKQNVTFNIGRNGIGSSYKNTHMSFTSPVRIIVVNS